MRLIAGSSSCGGGIDTLSLTFGLRLSARTLQMLMIPFLDVVGASESGGDLYTFRVNFWFGMFCAAHLQIFIALAHFGLPAVKYVISLSVAHLHPLACVVSGSSS